MKRISTAVKEGRLDRGCGIPENWKAALLGSLIWRVETLNFERNLVKSDT
jgi:hypothetical protein